MANQTSTYFVSETDIQKMLKIGGMPDAFNRLFTKDYAAVKRDLGSSSREILELQLRADGFDNQFTIVISRLDNNDIQIASLDSRLDSAEATIADHETRLDATEFDIAQNRIDFDNHVADNTVHGVTGDVVGNGDYAQAVTGGVVLLAAAVANAANSAVNVTQTANAAGVVYVQADAATWVSELAEHKTAINQLATDLNALVTKLNALLASERAAKQLAP